MKIELFPNERNENLISPRTSNKISALPKATPRGKNQKRTNFAVFLIISNKNRKFAVH